MNSILEESEVLRDYPPPAPTSLVDVNWNDLDSRQWEKVVFGECGTGKPSSKLFNQAEYIGFREAVAIEGRIQRENPNSLPYPKTDIGKFLFGRVKAYLIAKGINTDDLYFYSTIDTGLDFFHKSDGVFDLDEGKYLVRIDTRITIERRKLRYRRAMVPLIYLYPPWTTPQSKPARIHYIDVAKRIGAAISRAYFRRLRFLNGPNHQNPKKPKSRYSGTSMEWVELLGKTG